MRLLFFYFFIFFNFSIIAQQDYCHYYTRLYYANALVRNGKVDAALKIYDSLVNNYKLTKDASYAAGVIMYKKKNYGLSAKYFSRLAFLGVEFEDIGNSSYSNCPLCFTISDLNNLHEKIDVFRKNYLENLAKSSTSYNREFDEGLKRIMIIDQTIRAELDISEDNNCYLTYSVQRNKKINQVDSINLIELKRLIKKYSSLPVLHLVSPKSLNSFSLILAHNSTNNWAFKYCDSLLKEVRQRFKNGNCLSPENFANIIDRRFHETHKANYYCQFVDKDLPIYEKEKLNLRRNEIFLTPMEIK